MVRYTFACPKCNRRNSFEPCANCPHIDIKSKTEDYTCANCGHTEALEDFTDFEEEFL